MELSDARTLSVPIDNVTVRDALSNRSLLDKAGGAAYLVDLVESTPGASNVAAYARIVRERATRRRMLAVANGIAASTLDPECRQRDGRRRGGAGGIRDPRSLKALAKELPCPMVACS